MSGYQHTPPKWANSFLEWFCAREYLDEVQGDLLEAYHHRIKSIGRKKASMYFILDVFKSIRSSNIKKKKKQSFYQKNYMVNNYLKIAGRSMAKNAFYSIINILGLSIGISCTLLILFFVRQETSYDTFHKNAENIYRISQKVTENGELVEKSASLPWSVGPTLVEDYPDLKVTRMYQTWQKIPLLSDLENDAHFYEENLYFVDSSFFSVFSFPLIKGNPQQVLKRPQSLVITESMAQKYFPGEDPVGKTLRFENSLDFTITGVAEDVPVNSHFHFDFLAPLLNIGEIFAASGNRWSYEGWYWNPVHTYIVLPERYSQDQFNQELVTFVDNHFPPNFREGNLLELQPLTDIHLKSHLYQEHEPNRNEQSIFIAISIAAFILIIAAINFVNLTTARSFQRAKEVALRKVMGSSRSQVTAQFFGESLLTALAALMISFLIILLFLQPFESIVGVTLDLGNIISPSLVVYTLASTLILGIFSGFYPAILLSRFNPVNTLRMGSTGSKAGGSSLFRKILVIFQFTITVILLISAVIVYQQHDFLTTKELGFNREEIIMIPIQGTSIKARREEFKTELARSQQVMASCALSDIVGEDAPNRPFGVRGEENRLNLPGLFTDHDFIKTFQIELLEGRDFTKENPADNQTFLINRKMTELLPEQQWEGEAIQWGDQWRPIIGVVDDFHFMDLKHEVRPLVISFSEGFIGYIAVRIKPGDLATTIRELEKVWKQFEPVRPFTPIFLNDQLNELYASEKTTGKMISYFSILAIVIACLGLLGLATYSTQIRVKEIGIRKVLGATSHNLLRLISKDFALLVLIAIMLAWPLAWYLIEAWLNTFTFRIEPNWLVFLLSGIGALLVALITISYNALKAASDNPVNSLRSE